MTTVDQVNRTLLADLDPARRPRERLLRQGPDALSDAELVALLLGSGRRGRGAIDVARDLLQEHGGLPGLARAVPEALTSTPGVGPAKATRVVAALALARRFGTSTDRRDTLRTPADVARVAAPLLDRVDDRRVAVLVGDRAGRLLGTTVLPSPLAHDDPFSVREVLAETLRRGGVTLALAHRHTTGAPEDAGSGAGTTAEQATAHDLAVSRAVAEAAGPCGVRLLDHLVLAGAAWTSAAPPEPGGGG